MEVQRLTETAKIQRHFGLRNGIGTVENLKELTLYFANYATNLLQDPTKTQHLDAAKIAQITECIAEWRNDAEAL